MAKQIKRIFIAIFSLSLVCGVFASYVTAGIPVITPYIPIEECVTSEDSLCQVCLQIYPESVCADASCRACTVLYNNPLKEGYWFCEIIDKTAGRFYACMSYFEPKDYDGTDREPTVYGYIDKGSVYVSSLIRPLDGGPDCFALYESPDLSCIPHRFTELEYEILWVYDYSVDTDGRVWYYVSFDHDGCQKRGWTYNVCTNMYNSCN